MNEWNLSDDVEDLKASSDKTIVDIKLMNNKIYLKLDDGSKFQIWDSGQQCCENRYIDSVDDPSRIVGQKFLSVSVLDAGTPPHHNDDDGCHEVQFLEIKTDKDVISFASHNEHDGFYSGISLIVRKVK